MDSRMETQKERNNTRREERKRGRNPDRNEGRVERKGKEGSNKDRLKLQITKLNRE
jgi:hypothetical protein